MAAAVEDFLTCQVCKNRCKDPQIMTCFHTACSECLLNEDKTFECPACSSETDVELLPVVQPKRTEFLSNMKRKSTKTQRVKCQTCEDNKKAAYKCVEADCKMAFCDKCVIVHSKMRATKHHDVLRIEEYEDPNVRSQHARKVYCPTHENQLLTFYCEPCATLVCIACTVAEHRWGEAHNPKEVTKVVPEYKKSIKGLMKDTEAAKMKTNMLIENLGKELKATTEGYELAEQEITQHYKELDSKLKGEKQQMITKVRKIKVDRQGELHSKIIEMNSKLEGEYIRGLAFCQNMVDQDNNTDFLILKEQMEERLQKLASEPIDLSAVSFQLPSLSLSSVKETADVFTVRVDVKGPAVENQPCDVTVTTDTVDLIGGDEPQIEIVSPKGVITPLQPTAQLNTNQPLGEGSVVSRTWGAVWRPQASGNHSLSVFMRGKKQPGSLTVDVGSETTATSGSMLLL